MPAAKVIRRQYDKSGGQHEDYGFIEERAVSYTHLVLRMLKEADGYISGQEICEKFDAVSYTHLDVYKRQQ